MDEDSIYEFIEDRYYDLLTDFMELPENQEINDKFYAWASQQAVEYAQMRAEDAVDNAIEQEWLDKHDNKEI